MDDDPSLVKTIERELGQSITDNQPLQQALNQAHQYLKEQGVTQETLQDKLVACLVKTAELCCEGVVIAPGAGCNLRDRKWDRILTGKWTGIPIMILLLLVIFWITITGANYPSQLLSDGLFWVQDRLTDFFTWLGTPEWVHGVLVLGIYRTLAWVVSVMLPPMAIFFPLFTLLEDFGYLPRVAFNLDHQFKKACACGKQALTMWLEKDGMQMASGQAQAHIYGDKRRGPLCVSIASTPI